jgi:hypothetical protein
VFICDISVVSPPIATPMIFVFGLVFIVDAAACIAVHCDCANLIEMLGLSKSKTHGFVATTTIICPCAFGRQPDAAGLLIMPLMTKFLSALNCVQHKQVCKFVNKTLQNPVPEGSGLRNWLLD